MSNLGNILIDAFLDGFSGAGLFGKLRRPGAPTELVDSRSLEEFKASGEFDALLRRYGKGAGEALRQRTGRAGLLEPVSKDKPKSAVAR